MNVQEFRKIRGSIEPVPDGVFDEVDYRTTEIQSIPVINENGVLISVQRRVNKKVLEVDFEAYNTEFMLKNGCSSIGSQPMSNFEVFDKLRSLISIENKFKETNVDNN